MAGFLLIGIIVLYVMLYKYVVSKVYEKTKSIKKTKIAIAIMILIPTWDVMLGFPLYASLCLFNSGPNIYKTVDNVEGYYIGEVSEHGYRILLFEEDYKYKDYKLKSNGKYYRTYWLNNNTSELCVKPDYLNNPRQSYTMKFHNGQCVAVEQISEENVSKWEVINGGESTYIPIIRIKYGSEKTIRERLSGEILGKRNSVRWCGGWVNSSLGLLVGRSYGCGASASCGRTLSKKDDITLKVLKVKELGLYNQPKKPHIENISPNNSFTFTPNSSLLRFK